MVLILLTARITELTILENMVLILLTARTTELTNSRKDGVNSIRMTELTILEKIQWVFFFSPVKEVKKRNGKTTFFYFEDVCNMFSFH